jgi:hypothetical protein
MKKSLSFERLMREEYSLPVHMARFPPKPQSADPKYIERASRAGRFLPILKRAARKGHTEAYKVLLVLFLDCFKIELPRGVITPWKIKTAGAPRKPKNTSVRELWNADGRPKITNALCRKYARLLFPDELADAARGGLKQKNLINKVRIMLSRQPNDPKIPKDLVLALNAELFYHFEVCGWIKSATKSGE